MWKDSETEIDFLDYDYLVRILEDIVMNNKLLPASIGVYGDWGSGKSSLMHMCKTNLEQKDKKISCLMFNGWLFENYEDAKTAMLGNILDEIGNKKRLSSKAKDTLTGLYKSVDKLKLAKNATKMGIDFFLTGGIGTIADFTIKEVMAKVGDVEPDIKLEKIKTAIENELDNKEFREDIRKFQSDFEKLLKESKISRLVIFIDELDRCRPDTILETLEAMKLFMFTGKVAFVIGADERHISYAVKSKFKDIEGIQINIGQEYLEKLVQYPIKIPRMNEDEVETYIACLLLQDELEESIFDKLVKKILSSRKEDFEKFSLQTITDELEIDVKDNIAVASQVSSVLAKGLHGNPRQCKRFLNSLYMRLKMAKFKNKVLDKKILAKIMMLEYIKPQLFNKIAEMTMDGSLQKELLILENNKEEEKLEIEGAFKMWGKDEWFLNWCSTAPKLSCEDLKIYFYFMRTSLDEKISRISSTLSPEAKEILDKLLSKSDIKADEALTAVEQFSPSEKAIILEAMAINMSSQTNIDKNSISSFVKFVLKSPELWSEALAHFNRFSAEQIPVGSAVYIANIAKNTDMETEYRELFGKWGKSKPQLQKLIENALDLA